MHGCRADLGPQAFWIGPDDAPFLVKMGPELVAAGTEVLIEQTVDSCWDCRG